MIRFAEPRDTAMVRALWEVCFPDDSGFNDYFFQHHYQPQHTLLLTGDAELCAMLQMLPYRLSAAEGKGEITYIYGACTAPAHRRKGCMARLLEQSFVLDQAAGRAASALIPAEEWLFGFYAPFGYRPFFHIDTRIIHRTQGGTLPQRLTTADIPEMDRLYRTHTGGCRIVRKFADWQTQLALFDTLGKGVYGWFDGAHLTAYAFCWEDTAQEVLGLTAQQEQGLLLALERETLSMTSCGQNRALGCIKWYGQPPAANGYMNLMFN